MTTASRDQRKPRPSPKLFNWVGTKLRWKLSADFKERAALDKLATGSPS
ncbi:hypothetical protein ACFVZJ_37245 [Streptomyces sp. NPDC058322]|uniref:Uncharacterized protein n=1 Tax=Streptomyces sanglieri TaxID=193460 RepID=A0ABW2WLE0_9ACTN